MTFRLTHAVPSFSELSVLAGHGPMVGCQDDRRILVQSGFFKRIQKFAEPAIHMAQLGCIERFNSLLYFGLVFEHFMRITAPERSRIDSPVISRCIC